MSTPQPQCEAPRISASGGVHPALLYVAVCVLSAGLLVATTQHGVAWQDSGIFQLRVMRGDLTGQKGLALAHPLLIVLGRAMTWLVPCGDLTWRMNLLSALATAVAAANAAWLILRLCGPGRSAAWLAAGALMLAHTVWWLGTICESHALLAALLTAELHALLWLVRGGRWRAGLCLGLLNGLAVSTHNLALLAAPAYVICVVVLCLRGRLRWRAAACFLVGWLAGAGLLLVLVVQAAARQGLGAAVTSVLFGQGWRTRVLGLSGRAGLRGAAYVLYNFPNAAVPLAAVGCWRVGRLAPRAVAWTLRYLLAAHLLFALRYAVADQFMFFTGAYVALAVLAGVGLAWLMREGRRRALPAAALATLALGPALYAVAPWACGRVGLAVPGRADLPYRDPAAYWLQPWKSGENSAARFAEKALASVPAGSVIVADGTAMPALEWTKRYGRRRADVELLPLAEATRERLAGRRAVYVVSDRKGYCPDWIRHKAHLSRGEGSALFTVAWKDPAD